MERLTFSTKKYGAGLWECPNFSCGEICEKNYCETCPIQKAFDRLADYEDTGYAPEEIKDMEAELSNYRYDRIMDKMKELED